MFAVNGFKKLYDTVTDLYSIIWKLYIRPTRDDYIIEDLGPSLFSLNNSYKSYKRTDFEIEKSDGIKLQCSHFEPSDSHRRKDKLPVVIYMHGNSGCRLESLNLLSWLLPLNYTLLTFDFTGCGMSDGEYITLGPQELDDAKVIIDHMRSLVSVSSIVLWGRSMGAFTAINYASQFDGIDAVIADSPFFDLYKVSMELAQSFLGFSLPTPMVKSAIAMVRQILLNKVGLDLYDNNLKNKKCRCPLLIMYGNKDDFIDFSHSLEIYKISDQSMTVLLEIDGNHNSIRNDVAITFAVEFLNVILEFQAKKRKLNEQQKALNFLVKDPAALSDNSTSSQEMFNASPTGLQFSLDSEIFNSSFTNVGNFYTETPDDSKYLSTAINNYSVESDS